MLQMPLPQVGCHLEAWACSQDACATPAGGGGEAGAGHIMGGAHNGQDWGEKQVWKGQVLCVPQRVAIRSKDIICESNLKLRQAVRDIGCDLTNIKCLQ